MAIPAGRGPAARFDPGVPSPGVIGDPIGRAARWIRAGAGTGSGVAAQAMVLGGEPPAGAGPRAHIPGGGTPWASLGSALREAGLRVDAVQGAAFEQVEDALIAGGWVLAVVDGASLDAAAGGAGAVGAPGDRPGRVVEVTGLDWTHPSGGQVVVNDPVRDDGMALLVPMAGFGAAWDAWGRRALIVARP